MFVSHQRHGADRSWSAQAGVVEQQGGPLALLESPLQHHALTAMGLKEKLLARLGPESADAIDEFLSLTLVHERSHSPSLEGFLDWVERGVAPDKIIASKLPAGETTGTPTLQRPLCPYPQISRYNGRGRTSDPSSFECVAAKGHHDPRNRGPQNAYR